MLLVPPLLLPAELLLLLQLPLLHLLLQCVQLSLLLLLALLLPLSRSLLTLLAQLSLGGPLAVGIGGALLLPLRILGRGGHAAAGRCT